MWFIYGDGVESFGDHAKTIMVYILGKWTRHWFAIRCFFTDNEYAKYAKNISIVLLMLKQQNTFVNLMGYDKGTTYIQITFV